MSGEKLSEKAKVRSVFVSLLIVSRAIPKTISRQVEYQIVYLHKVTIACIIWHQFGCCLETWTKLQLLQQYSSPLYRVGQPGVSRTRSQT